MSEQIKLKVHRIVESSANGGTLRVREISFGKGQDAPKIWIAIGKGECVCLKSNVFVPVEDLRIGDCVRADVMVATVKNCEGGVR